jgi:hypothetical protein
MSRVSLASWAGAVAVNRYNSNIETAALTAPYLQVDDDKVLQRAFCVGS